MDDLGNPETSEDAVEDNDSVSINIYLYISHEWSYENRKLSKVKHLHLIFIEQLIKTSNYFALMRFIRLHFILICLYIYIYNTYT